MHIFVLNLERSPDRRQRMNDKLRALGLSAEFFPAIDGQKFTTTPPQYKGRLRRLFYGKDMSMGEIACAMSHIAVSAEIAKRNIPYALVLEDDAILKDNLDSALSALEACADEWDIVRFLDKDKDIRRSVVVRGIGGNMALARVYGVPGGAYGYIVNAHAARQLARHANSIWMPSDTLHGQIWRHGLRVRCLLPPPVTVEWEAVSTIGSARFERRVSLHGWERRIYPLTRALFKIFELLTKNGYHFTGMVRDAVVARRNAKHAAAPQ